ncbi:hypothetical protein RHMOL_Rhmol02G0301600 [Rhododendron molle]|uniref:Uncharacterized protein n=1 Tax=Rhododendron molle TaxID=49168 RepID=A0ACC0PYZ9_RHOML|nr:hypothetical protein RHMOL_Rhmol02G0301600 [Rhododendron molle]
MEERNSIKHKDTTEAAIAGVKSIADSCIRSKTVKRLVYTASVMASSPLKEDGTGYKSSLDESCWTPLNLSFTFSNDSLLIWFGGGIGVGKVVVVNCGRKVVLKRWGSYVLAHLLAPRCIQVLSNATQAHLLAHQVPRNAPGRIQAYTKSKTLAEKEVLSYNEIENGKLEVVSLACGQVGGDNTLLPYLPASVAVTVSQITGNLSAYNSLRFLQELLGSIPMVHIDDVREAHIFCIEKESLRGRFLCTPADPTVKEIAKYYQENYPPLKISEELMGGPDRGSRCDSTKLVELGFEFKYDMKKILDDCVACLSRLKALSSI